MSKSVVLIPEVAYTWAPFVWTICYMGQALVVLTLQLSLYEAPNSVSGDVYPFMISG